jgi:hypothetical protein
MWRITREDGSSVDLINNTAVMLYLNTSDEADFNEITSIEKITKTVIEDVKPEEVKCSTWQQFRECGMLWWINMILHTFGWSIVLTLDGDIVKDAYPARVKFRGFSTKNNTEGYIKVSQYMKENAGILLEEAKE